MAEVRIGTVLQMPDGGTAVVNGVFPQPVQPIYRVTFADGRSTDTSADHLWTVHCIDWRRSKRRGNSAWQTLTTDELLHRIETKRAISVPLIRPLQSKAAGLPLDPYLLGVLLGDGNLANSSVLLSSADQEIVEGVRGRLEPDYELVYMGRYDYRIRLKDHARARIRATLGQNWYGLWHHYRAALDDLGLMGCKSHNKFIPPMYLEKANTEQRLELVRGLIDTDGYVGRHGDISFTTTSEVLAEQFADLIRSLGGIASLTSKQPWYKHAGERRRGRIAYTIKVRYHTPRDLMTLSRKMERISPGYQYANTLRLRVTKIEEIGNYPCQCISVNHPDQLYITDHFIVTHNTLITAALSNLVEDYGRSIVIVPSKNLVIQTEEDYRNLGLDVGVYFGDRKEWNHRHTIATWQSLEVLNKAGTLHEFIKGVVCVISDEAHVAKAKLLKDLLTGPFAHVPIRWGLTGTVPKEDHESICLLAAIGPVVGSIRAVELQEKGVLADCQVEIMQLQDNHVEFRSYDSEHEFLVTDDTRLRYIAGLITAWSHSGNALVLVDRIETGETLAKLLGAVFICGETKIAERQEEYKSVQTSDRKIIVATYGVASVGINLPRIYNLVLLEPGKSFVRVIQSIGRGLRRAKDKDYIRIVDLCSSLKYSKRHLSKRKSFYNEQEYPHTTVKLSYY